LSRKPRRSPQIFRPYLRNLQETLNSSRLKHYFSIFIFLLCSPVFSQNSLIGVDEQVKDIGVQEQIYKISADYILENKQAKNLYLLRADAQKGVTIRAAKKTLKPGDTTVIVVEFIPQSTGKFTENINLVTSADALPFKLSLSGNIKSIKTDDKTACFYFKRPNNAGVKTVQTMVVAETNKPRDNSNRIPDNTGTHVAVTPTLQPLPEPKPEVTEPTVKPKEQTLLDETLYKPNNIIFLVDVSSSMKDSAKLPVMQAALHYLIDALRPGDKITFITYADSVRTLRDGVSGSNKDDLNSVVEKLKAKGLTRGNKAILFSLDIALKNYLTNGNNQIILATDGKFRFYSEDQQKYIARQGDRTVKLSTMAFGNDKDAIKNLKEIAEIGKGNFIHIKNRSRAKEQLLEEIKDNSLIR
jgi:Mg-chelatase subunit ChlD